jgi:hypothetical protein
MPNSVAVRIAYKGYSSLRPTSQNQRLFKACLPDQTGVRVMYARTLLLLPFVYEHWFAIASGVDLPPAPPEL